MGGGGEAKARHKAKEKNTSYRSAANDEIFRGHIYKLFYRRLIH